jgi:hypothetical protein
MMLSAFTLGRSVAVGSEVEAHLDVLERYGALTFVKVYLITAGR